MSSGGVCIMRYVSCLFFLLCSFNSNAYESARLFKIYDDKIGDCNQLRNREVKDINDLYFNSLSLKQKSVVVGILSIKAMDECFAYEEARFLKQIITSNDQKWLPVIGGSFRASKESDESKKIRESLDINELERLSNTIYFSTPFHPIDVMDNIE